MSRKPNSTPPPKQAERPRGGGSFVRDRKTGKLTRREDREAAPPPAPPPAGETDGQTGGDAGKQQEA